MRPQLASSDRPPDTGHPPDRDHPPDPRRVLGALGESFAAAHYERLGFEILARNVRTRRGEIDLIAFDGDTLAFVEVKSARVRGGAVGIQPLERLGFAQRARLRRLATAWLATERDRRAVARTIRFDAVGVLVDRRDRLVQLDQVENAW